MYCPSQFCHPRTEYSLVLPSQSCNNIYMLGIQVATFKEEVESRRELLSPLYGTGTPRANNMITSVHDTTIVLANINRSTGRLRFSVSSVNQTSIMQSLHYTNTKDFLRLGIRPWRILLKKGSIMLCCNSYEEALSCSTQSRICSYYAREIQVNVTFAPCKRWCQSGKGSKSTFSAGQPT